MFTAHLINDAFDDPGVYVEFKYRRLALLFDLGDMHRLEPRKLLKVSHIFISHTHMDHFIGFDQLLRVCLGRDHHIHIFGPPGFHQQVENKINAYTWNLVDNYQNDFALHTTEIHRDRMLVRHYRCRNSFEPEIEHTAEKFKGHLFEGKYYLVQGTFLDHKIPSLAYRFEEKSRINIKKNALEEMGLPVGAWLLELKNHIMNDDPDDTPVRVWHKAMMQPGGERFVPLGELKKSVVKISPGQKIAYVTDAVFSEENAKRIVALADGVDILFIESAFLHEEAERAAKKYHLTARQAGTLARLAGVKRMIQFHFSPKYKGAGNLLIDEANQAFSGQILLI